MQCGCCGKPIAQETTVCSRCRAEYRKVAGVKSVTFLAAAMIAGLAFSIPGNQPVFLAVGLVVGLYLFYRHRIFAWVRR